MLMDGFYVVLALVPKHCRIYMVATKDKMVAGLVAEKQEQTGSKDVCHRVLPLSYTKRNEVSCRFAIIRLFRPAYSTGNGGR